MQSKRPTTIYRSLFSDAFRVAWKRKPLWVFGLFAALLSTGGVCEMAAKEFRNLATVRDVYASMLNGTFTGIQTLGQVIGDAVAWNPVRLSISLSFLLAFGILAVVASVVSQGALIRGVERKAVSDAEAAAAGRAAFWHMLWLNLLHKAAQLVLILLSALPMLWLVARADAASMTIAMLTFLVAFPLTIALSVLFVLASVHAVKTGSHALDAIHEAAILFRSHWVAAFETGVFLFGSVILATLAFAAAAAIVSVPFAVAIAVSLLAGNALSFLVVNALGAGMLVLLLFVFAGAVTTFQYAVWVRFYEHGNVRRKIISKVHRMWKGR